MMGINIVTANFSNGGRQSITRKLYQYDYGQKINIKGLKLPSTFEVHISNDHKANTAQIYIGNNNEIEIPDKFLLSGQDIYIWIFLHSTETDGETRYTITIPVQTKPKPESQEPTVVEKNTIDQLIAALENNLNEMRQATEDTKTVMDEATAAAKEQMQLAIDKANDTVSKYPKIVDDYWYVYDVENQVWVNTQIKALAIDGVGIKNIVYNNDYTITINLTDGTSYTTNSIRGEKGDKGDTGATPNIKIKTTETIAPNQYANVKIEGTPENPELTFRIPKGEKGDKGDTGAMPQISIGTVETLLPHRVGYVTQTGTTENPVLNFGLVKGETGQAGKTAYEYAIENGYSGNENDFSNALANLATLQEVDRAIAEAMGDITGFEFQIVQNLPVTGEKGIIYLVPHSHGTGDIYDEYIWVTDGFEKIGSTDIDLSDYLQISDIAEWAKAQTKPVYTAAEVGAIGIEQLSQAIDSALAQAKKSGEFNGPQGETGPQGAKGDKGDTGEKGDKGDAGDVSAAQFEAALANKADIIINSASGAIASFKDGADDLPMKSLVCNIEPVQDLHGYDSPWPAGGGTNLLPFEDVLEEGWTNTLNGITATYSNGYMRVTGTNTSSEFANIAPFRSAWLSSRYEFGAGSYAIPDQLVVTMAIDGGSDLNKAGVVTANTSISVRGFYVTVGAGQTVDWNIPMMFTKGTTIPTAYAPYSNICPISGRTGLTVSHSGADTSDPVTISVNWETEAGTVYGGTLDVISGKLTVDKAKIVYNGSETWALYNSQNGFIKQIPLMAIGTNLNGKANWLKTVKSVTQFGISFGGNNNSVYCCHITDNIPGVTDGNTWKDYLANNNLEVCYPLATPTEIQLTSQEVRTLLGENNIWSDAGDMTVEYPADTKLYIDQKITEAIAAALA